MQCRSRRAVPDARHQLLGARTRRGCEGVAGVAQVLEAQTVAADGLAHGVPLAVPAPSPQRCTLRAREHDSLGFGADEAVHVVRELVDHERRQRDRASAGVSLRWAEHPRATGQLEGLLHHLDCASLQVDALPGQCCQLPQRSEP